MHCWLASVVQCLDLARAKCILVDCVGVGLLLKATA